jgi:hypothetical protein
MSSRCSDLLELKMLTPLWVRAAPAGPSSIAHARAGRHVDAACPKQPHSASAAARPRPSGFGPFLSPERRSAGRPQSRATLSGPAMWRDASRIRRSVAEAISSSCPHGTTSGWLLAALGPEHGLRQHLVCLSRSATRWNSSRDLWRLSREHPERRNRLRLRRVRTEE